MPAALFRLIRGPDGWGYTFMMALAVVALANAVVMISGVSGIGEQAAAGWFLGVVGLVLVALLAVGIRQDLRGRQQSVVTEIANVIIEEEEAAGREVEERFAPEPQFLPQGSIVRILCIVALLSIGWMVAMPWIGFGLATGLFCLGFMRFGSRSRWWVALITAACVGAGLAVLFSLAGVLLPTGAFWYLF